MKYKCVDVGSENCPCPLLEAGRCKVCSSISTGKCDECSWDGSCVYSRYIEENHRVHARIERPMEILCKRKYSEDLTVFQLKCDRGFAQKCSNPGACVFVRADEEKWSDTIISVLKADLGKGMLHIGINTCGPKTFKLAQAEKFLYVRGVYNFGLENLDILRGDGKAIVYSKGIAIAPLRNIVDEGLLADAKYYIDADKTGLDFIMDYFGDLPAAAVSMTDMNDIAFDVAANTHVIALMSPYFVDKVEKVVKRKVVKPKEGRFCCGEGICGACSFDDQYGETVHKCKDAGLDKTTENR